MHCNNAWSMQPRRYFQIQYLQDLSQKAQCLKTLDGKKHRRRNWGGGGTRGICPPLVRICLLVPPFKLSGTVTFLTIPRRWNTCSDGSAIPEHGERRSKNTRARYSSGIESKYKFEYKYGLRSDLTAPNFKNFSGGACPQTPLVRPCLRTHHHRCPPNRKYFPPPMI